MVVVASRLLQHLIRWSFVNSTRGVAPAGAPLMYRRARARTSRGDARVNSNSSECRSTKSPAPLLILVAYFCLLELENITCRIQVGEATDEASSISCLVVMGLVELSEC